MASLITSVKKYVPTTKNTPAFYKESLLPRYIRAKESY